MKKVSRRTRNLFMCTLLNAAAEHKTRTVSANHPGLSNLRSRNDFTSVMMVLEGLNLIEMKYIAPGSLHYVLTPQGMSYRERSSDERYHLIMNSFVIPVLVAIITTMVTVYILPSLGRSASKLLEGSLQCSPSPSSAIAPIDAQSEIQSPDPISSIPATIAPPQSVP